MIPGLLSTELVEALSMEPDREFLLDLAHARMPFGKYAGCRLSELPEAYLVWFKQRGWPAGKLGRQLASMYEISCNGQRRLLADLRRLYPERNPAAEDR